ncbi:MAG: hypothetical protein QNJ55_31340 [Xenococcus sp. MO_188.B8]|nr:hypothetical protein [Xenococcus sp. MO_188.B8]
MKNQSLTLPKIVQSFEEEFKELARLCFWITTDSNKLKNTCIRADNLSAKARSAKNCAQKQQEESEANLFFSMECAALFLKRLGEVWLELKAEKPHKAWHALMDAQEYLRIAIQAHGTPELRKHLLKLENIELTIFPKPSKFISPGIIYKSGKCTICGVRFDKCEHEEGLIYMGNLCMEVQRRIVEINHFALVEKPRDKRCYIDSWEDDTAQRIDHFTQMAIEDTKFSKNVLNDQDNSSSMNSEGRKASARLLYVGGLPHVYPGQYSISS